MLMDLHAGSQVLGVETTVTVLLPGPQEMVQRERRPIPTLYLLHGLSDDHRGWTRYTSLERYAWDYDLAVVMPAVNRSFYADMAHGAAYFTYVTQELPQLMESIFPLSTQREERFVAGLSMGGYGAMRVALGCPERYAAAASLSGALEIQERYHIKEAPISLQEMDDIFGSEQALLAGDNNLWNLAARLAKTPEKAPKLYVACGTKDDLLPANDHFVADFGKDLSIQYHRDAGAHTWAYWDRHIREVLAWLPLGKRS